MFNKLVCYGRRVVDDASVEEEEDTTDEEGNR
jgi:hypothetical protein